MCGYSMAHVFIPAQAAGFATISPADTARASTLFNALRQLGSAVGVALLSTVVAEVGPLRTVAGRTLPNLTSYHDAFLAAAGVAILAAGCALTISDADAAGTMVRRHGRRIRFHGRTCAVAGLAGCRGGDSGGDGGHRGVLASGRAPQGAV